MEPYAIARDGCARVVLVVGEPGIDKTLLMDEVALRANQGGAIILRGGASEAKGMPPYLPFLEALGQHIRVTPPDQLRKQTATAPYVLANILPELPARLSDSPTSHSSPPEPARLWISEAIGTFLAAIGEPCVLVLILDDLHWADTVSLELLCYIARRQAESHLLMLGAYRDSEIDHNPALARTVEEHVWAEFQPAAQLVCPGGLILIHNVRYGAVEKALQRIEAAGCGVVRLAECGECEDDQLGLAVIENSRCIQKHEATRGHDLSSPYEGDA